MADSIQQALESQTAALEVNFVDTVRAVVDENQPMCVVGIAANIRQARVKELIEPKPTFAEVEAAVVSSLYERLEIQRRKYDTLTQVQGASFLLIVKTLADAPILNARLQQISEFLAQPHELPSGPVVVPVHIGAAIRQPNELAETVAERIHGALQQAESTNRGHVLMM